MRILVLGTRPHEKSEVAKFNTALIPALESFAKVQVARGYNPIIHRVDYIIISSHNDFSGLLRLPRRPTILLVQHSGADSQQEHQNLHMIAVKPRGRSRAIKQITQILQGGNK